LKRKTKKERLITLLEQAVEAIRSRHSVRAYLDRPVPDGVLEEVLQTALQAPSWGNTQPWEVAVAGGNVLAAIKTGLGRAVAEGRPPAPDFPFPASWPEANQKRYFENGERLHQALGIARDDQKGRDEQARRGFEFFGAPRVLFLFLDEGLSTYSLFDLGLFAQNLLLAAHARGLGTCPMARPVIYPDIVRRELGLPPAKKLVLAIPIGYPDVQAPVNSHRSTRVPLDEAVRFFG